jgi:ligand-binding sensor domain-containing protein/signal transduction histidine kinase
MFKTLMILFSIKKLILPVFLLALIPAKSQNYIFRHFTTNDGLSYGNASCFLKDSKGFIWIGTEDGLNKYDGYDFTIFRNNPLDSSTLSDNIVQCIAEDGNYLWIGTRSGLNRFNKLTEKVTRYYHNKNDENTLNDNLISCLFKDRKGRIWIGTDNGFNLYNPMGKFKRYLLHSNFIDNTSHNWVRAITEGADGLLWISTVNGLYHFNPESNQFNTSPGDREISNSFDTKVIDYTFEDKSHNLWVGTYEKGLFMKEKRTNKLFHFTHEPKEMNSLCNNLVDHIMEDDEGNIWVATNSGLSCISHGTIIRQDNGIFKNYRHINNEDNGLSTNSITTTFQDNEKNIWIGGRFGDLDVMAKPLKKFVNYKFTEMGSQFISNNMTAIAEDKDGNLWFGSDGGGIYFWDRKNNKYKVYRNINNDKSSIASDKVLALCIDSYNNLWIGMWKGGLDRMDLNNHSIVHYKSNENDKCSPVSNNVFYIKEDKLKDIWIGFWGTGINLYDRKSNCFKHFHYGSYDSTSLSGYNVLNIFEDKNSNIWIGTETDGVSLLNKKNYSFKHYNLNSPNKASISVGVNTIYEDRKNRFWIGTRLGFILLDRKTEVYSKFTTKDGLPNDFICGILEDEEGNLWLSTNNGISKLTVKEKGGKLALSFRNYDQTDGLPNNQFNKWSYFKTSRNEFIFGGLSGLTIFYPDSFKDNKTLPSTVITGFSIFNSPVPFGVPGSPLKEQISETKEITLSYKQSVISFDYAALNFSNPEKTRYAYKMDGFEKEWNLVGNQRKATFTNLNPGKYTFMVKACNSDGYWNNKSTCIKLTILPPWWLTWWLKAISITLIILFILIYTHLKTARYKKRQKDLILLVEQRTSELVKTNKLLLERHLQIEEYALKIKSHNEVLKVVNGQLCEQQSLIKEQSNKMRENSMKMEKANKLLIQRKNLIELQAEKLKETNQQLTMLNSSKDKFFSIIGHDLRNPFNVVMGFSDLLLLDYTKLTDEKIGKYLSIISTASKNGYNLLENLLQWSHTQTGLISYEPAEINLARVADESIVILMGDLQKKDISLQLFIDKNIMIYADENMVRTIFRNLVSNAIKFSRAGGKISILSNVNSLKPENEIQKEEDGYPKTVIRSKEPKGKKPGNGSQKKETSLFVEISVVDKGIGMSEESIRKLFNIETTQTTKGTSNETGTGLGLVLCKEFIEKHNGKIWVESELEKGSKFKFTLPLSHPN